MYLYKDEFHQTIVKLQAMKKYKSMIGLTMYVVITILCSLFFYELITDTKYTGAIITLLVILFFIYLFVSTDYIISGKTLTVKCSKFINESIDINSIKSIKEITGFFSAPAFSLKGLSIQYDLNDSIAISPVNRKDFIDSLLLVNPSIEILKKLRSKNI